MAKSAQERLGGRKPERLKSPWGCVGVHESGGCIGVMIQPHIHMLEAVV